MDVARFDDRAREQKSAWQSLGSLFKLFPLGNVDGELVEGQQRLMNQCPELVRDLYGQSVNAGMTSTRGSAAFCSCGVGTARPIMALRAFLLLLQHSAFFSSY